MSALPDAKAAVQRASIVAGGYMLGVRIATRSPVSDWYAEVMLPEGAHGTAGLGTTVEKRPLSLKLNPAQKRLSPRPGKPGAGVVWLAVAGSEHAPTHVRVWAKGEQGAGYIPVDAVFVTNRRGTLAPASETAWPGSTRVQLDPQKWSAGGGHGGGFGFGGGGGGGGQVELLVETDDSGRLRKVHHRTDCGGGGGAGGGGGMGGGWQEQAAAGQQQGQTEHGGGQHTSGNPLTTLQETVAALDKRVARLETTR